MRLFADTGDVNFLRKFAYLIDGVTTNPTIIAKEGRPFKELVQEICSIVDGPVNVEAVQKEAPAIVEEALGLSRMHKNIVVKIAMTEEGLRAVSELAKKGVKTNVTLVFSANQALLAAKAGANYVSPFIGRLDDAGQDGLLLIEEIMDIYTNYGVETEVIVASVRHPLHVVAAARIGAPIATVPPSVFELLFKHPLTDLGIKRFDDDWKKVQVEKR
ncbi:MAG: fructose-6-phosphate aldolase [Planctomycetota bacterium]|nr:fructose-6-phosphate aldolase [Planctomycetota bacterium]